MRVVDRKQIADAKVRRDKKIRRSKRTKKTSLLLLVIILGVSYFTIYRSRHAVAPTNQGTGQQQQSKNMDTVPKIANFSAEQFRDLYNSFSYPNTQQIDQPPEITGKTEADNRIRVLAEARGYRLRSVALDGLLPISTDFSVQPLALQPWLALQSAAAKDGLEIDVAAAYRSIDDQRELFISKINEEGITADDITSASTDEMVNSILARTAPPGYSRHHTGFTLDLICNHVGLYEFDSSPCYAWLSANNYAHAKQFGWVPSYPDGTTDQGPEPEPWEYIWVGRDAVYVTN